MFSKGWSCNPSSSDPTFYYYDKRGSFSWTDHPKNVNFKFSESSKRTWSRMNYDDIIINFKNRRSVCSYEGFLEYARSLGLVGGGKDGPENLWDSSFSRGICPPKDGYTYNEGFVFCTMKASFSSNSIISLPINCIDALGSFASQSCDWSFMINNQKTFDDNKHAFENYRIMNVRSEVNVTSSSDSSVLVKEGLYKLDYFNQPEKIKLMLAHPKTQKIKSRDYQFSIHTDAWKYVGCKEIYDATYSKSIIHGLDNHLFYNLIVDTGGGKVDVVIYFILKIQFYGRFFSHLGDLSAYYDNVEECAECETETGDSSGVSTKDDDLCDYDEEFDGGVDGF